LDWDHDAPNSETWRLPEGRLRVNLFRLPNYAGLSRRAQDNLSRIDDLVRTAGAGQPDRVLSWLAGYPDEAEQALGPVVDRLRHPLSEDFERIHRRRLGGNRSKIEMASLFGDLSQVDLAGGRLQDVLPLIARSVTQGLTTEFRTCAVRTVPDLAGNICAFVPVANIAPRLERLAAFCKRNRDTSPAAFVAMVLMIAVLNCHPFRDGNGRTSRLAYNWWLCTQLKARFYLPIQELADLTGGGFFIRQRLAERHGDWEPLSQYLVDATQFFAS